MITHLLPVLALTLSLTGCFSLKPAKTTERHFVLTALSSADSTAAPGGGVAVGLGLVKLPAYLFSTSFAVRRGTNEIGYLQGTIWAERLDAGLQRVLAANLGTLLPTDRIRLSAWQSADVAVEVYVAIEQFDVDAHGRGVILARWRTLSPGGDKTLKAASFHLERQGPAPDTNPSGAVATLSGLAAELSRQVAQAIKETTPPVVRR